MTASSMEKSSVSSGRRESGARDFHKMAAEKLGSEEEASVFGLVRVLTVQWTKTGSLVERMREKGSP